MKESYDFTEAEFAQNTDWIKRNLKREMYVTAFNLDESLKVAAETDPEVERAIDAMPKAKALLDTVHRIVVERMQPQPILAR
jgi:carboxyl-terminal processing protease